MSNDATYDRLQVSSEPNSDFYQLLQNPSAAVVAAADGSRIINTGGKTYARIYANLAWAEYEPAWFVDASSGSDNNSGTDAGHPLKTLRELSRRLWYARIRQNVVVTIASGNFDNEPFQFRFNIDNNISVTFKGHITSSAADVITTVLPTVPGSPSTNAGAQRGTITGTTGAFTDYSRLRITASATALGAMAFVTRVVSAGPGGTANVSRWGIVPDPLTQFTVQNKLPANGDSYVVDTYDTTVGDVDIQVTGWGIVSIQDLAFSGFTGASMGIRTHGGSQESGGVLFYACDIRPGGDVILRDGEGTYQLCQFHNVGLGDVSFLSYNADLHMCVLDRLHAQFGGYVSFYDGAVLRGPAQLEEGAFVTQEQTGGTNDMQCVGSGTYAIQVQQGATWYSKGIIDTLWGLDGVYSSAAFIALAGAKYQFASNLPSIPGGAVDWKFGASYSGAWANFPKNVSATTALEGKSFGVVNATNAAADKWMSFAPGAATVLNTVDLGQIMIGYNAVILGIRLYLDTALVTDNVTARLQVNKVDAASGMSVTVNAGTNGPNADLARPQVVTAGQRIAVVWRQSGVEALAGINARAELIILPVNS